MQPKMRIAQTVKRHLASLGYRVDLRPFHKQQVWLLVERMVNVILQVIYVLYVAKTSREYMETYFMIAVGILMYITLVSTIMEMPNIFILIDDMEQVIHESKYSNVQLKI